jgi:hypothetical protein
MFYTIALILIPVTIIISSAIFLLKVSRNRMPNSAHSCNQAIPEFEDLHHVEVNEEVNDIPLNNNQNNHDAGLPYTLQEIQQRIHQSNEAAGNNQNRYPIQEQASLTQILRFNPQGGPVKWTLREKCTAKEFIDSFLRMFVSNQSRNTARKYALNDKDLANVKIPTRIVNVIPLLRNIRKNWDEICQQAFDNPFSMANSGFPDLNQAAIHNIFQFNLAQGEPYVYKSKLASLLFPDFAIALDTESTKLIKRYFRGKSINITTYHELLTAIHTWIHSVVDSNECTFDDLRVLDSPNEIESLRLPENVDCIVYPWIGMNVNGYTPEVRPLSRIIDKIFYSPDGDRQEVTDEKNDGDNYESNDIW